MSLQIKTFPCVSVFFFCSGTDQFSFFDICISVNKFVFWHSAESNMKITKFSNSINVFLFYSIFILFFFEEKKKQIMKA